MFSWPCVAWLIFSWPMNHKEARGLATFVNLSRGFTVYIVDSIFDRKYLLKNPYKFFIMSLTSVIRQFSKVGA
jgi:hypothetical protein